jgi:N-acetylglutamate synthase-like GNAT family acetyltransferase
LTFNVFGVIFKRDVFYPDKARKNERLKGKPMANSKVTGLSSITGKIVYIRHATEWDLVELGGHLTPHQKDMLNLSQSEIVVAAEDERIIGFGILEKTSRNSGCLVVKKYTKRDGIGAFIVRHLLEYAPMKTIYTASAKPGYFRKLGFAKIKVSSQKPADRTEKNWCQWDTGKSSLAVYEKK